MDAETLAALKGSIAKWDAIADGTGSDQGVRNCPLCEMFCMGEGWDCEECPVAIKTGLPDCAGTPYSNWFDAYQKEFDSAPVHVKGGAYATTDELKSLARAEAAFLRSLLPQGETAP
jgi:hypothetical protein